MITLIEQAKRTVNSITASMSTDVANSRSLIAIALALIVIAEELEKSNSEVKNVRDRTWLYEK